MYNDTTGRKKGTMKQKTKQSQAQRDKKTRKKYVNDLRTRSNDLTHP